MLFVEMKKYHWSNPWSR